MKNNMYKIALVVRTDSLDYDDRIRKEMLSIQSLYPSVRFKIFAMLDENRDFEGMTSYGIPFKSIKLKSRDYFGTNKGHIFKAIESYTAVRKELKQFDVVWCADNQTFMIAALVRTNRLIWDLHELPDFFVGNKFRESLLKYIFNRCTVLVHANPQRINYLQEHGLILDPAKHFSLRNYPNFEDIDEEKDEKFRDFLSWKKERNCVYLQGLYGSDRAAEESINAVLEEGLCAVVVGRFDEKIYRILKEKWGEEFENRLFFTGKVPQLKIPQYVSECFINLIFYKYFNPNNIYCEANRFYQAIIMGIPVVVGKNPSMKALIDEYKFGVSIDDDGSNEAKIRDGIRDVIKNYNQYKKNAIDNRDKLLWSNQENEIKVIIEKLFEK